MRKNWHKIITLLLAMIMVFSLIACGNNTTPTSAPNQTTAGGGDSDGTDGGSGNGAFDWKQAEGSKLRVLLNQHPYAEAIVSKLDDFTALTGIEVDYSLTPEENYFDRVTTSLNSRSGDPDIFMTGAYQVWEYAPAGYVQELDGFISDPSKTSPDYDYDDFYEGIVGALKWDLVAGNKTGTGPQWALPLGFEMYTLAYNKRVFDERNLEPPETMEDLLALCEELQEFDGPGSYALALRGSRNWATIHPGYMTTFASYGAQDFAVEDGKLVSKVNSPEAVAMTEDWLEIIKKGGSPSWSSYTWYQAGADLGAGKAAMLYDADINGYFQNPEGASQESGNIAWVRAPLPEGKSEINSNMWTWALAMNASSKNQDAAWLFMQYYTSKEYSLWAAVNAKCVDPARKSAFEDPSFQEVIGKAEGFSDAFVATIDNTGIQFTPQPHFFETTTEWAATLQDLVGGNFSSTQEAMDALKNKMDEAVKNVVIE